MQNVTPEQCKTVVKEKQISWLGHHRCGGCGAMVGWEFQTRPDIHETWRDRLGVSDDNLVVFFQPACDCGGGFHAPEPRAWSEFANSFNMQTPEIRERMWKRFEEGRATHETD